MTPKEIRTKLSQIADELLDVAELLPSEEARKARKASHLAEEVRLGVSELVTIAAHQRGHVGPVEVQISRPRYRREVTA